MKKLMQLLESTVPTTISYKGNMPDKVLKVDPTDQETVNNIKTDPNIDHASMGQKRIKEEAGRKYTTEESAAVGKTVAKSLLKVLRGQGDEVVQLKLTGIGVNKFNIYVKYGNEKGQDTFRFTLNPDTEDITLDLGKGNHEQLVDFIITQGNTVSLPTPELENKLSAAMKKYTSEPSDDEYDQMAAMEPESDPSQIGKYISEDTISFKIGDKVTYLGAPGEITATKDYNGKQYVSVAYNKGQGRTKVSGVLATNGDVQHAKALQEKHLTPAELKKREEIVKAMKKQGAPKSPKTYAIATAQAEKLAETVDECDMGMHDDEPRMVLGDLYNIAQSVKDLYQVVSQMQQSGVDFPHWWQAKIINAKANLSAAQQYLDFESQKQQPVNIAAITLQERKNK